MKYATTRKPLAVFWDPPNSSGISAIKDNPDLSPIVPEGRGWKLVNVTVVPETGTRNYIDWQCGWIYWTWQCGSES